MLMLLEQKVSKFLQGSCVLCLYLFTIAGITFTLAAVCWPVIGLYLAWMFIDRKTSKRGGRKVGVDYASDLFAFRCVRDYYPISLVKTTDLDPTRNYIFGYHPHGFLPDGLVISFGTKNLGFHNKFPGITPHIGAHSCTYEKLQLRL